MYVTCETCNGSGYHTCPECDGRGEVEEFCGNRGCSNEEAAEEAGKFKDITCPRCDGWGKIKCPDCFGDGRYEL